MPFLTRSSHTWSQFHSPGFRGGGGSGGDVGSALSAASTAASGLAADPVFFACWRWCVRQAFHAPGLPAASSGMASRTAALSKVLRM